MGQAPENTRQQLRLSPNTSVTQDTHVTMLTWPAGGGACVRPHSNIYNLQRLHLPINKPNNHPAHTKVPPDTPAQWSFGS